MRTVSSILLFLFTIPDLLCQVRDNSKVTVINLEKSNSKQLEVPLSKFVEKITYVPLESNPQALIGGGGGVYYEVTDDYIIVRQVVDKKYQILLFDRNTGKYIREIGKNGRGPGEYSFFCFIPFNPIKKVIYAMSLSREILIYDISGKNIDKIEMPKYEEQSGEIISLSTKPILFEDMLNDSVFVGKYFNTSGLEKNKLVLLSKEGVLKIFPNYQCLNVKVNMGVNINRANSTFYKLDNKLYFLEAFVDTLYEVTKSKLIPRYFFDLGNQSLTWTKLADRSFTSTRGFSYIMDVDENKNYVFIKFRLLNNHFLGIIEKKTNFVTICAHNDRGESLLRNDLNELGDVLPLDFTQKNEMIYIIQPLELLSWLNMNPEKASLARTKFSWIRNIDEFSNPIIAIANCRN